MADNFFTVKVRGLDRLIKTLDIQIRDLLTPKELEGVMQEARDAIYKRTKAGRGVAYDVVEKDSPPPMETKLPPLSGKYKEQRKRKGVKGDFGSPNRSNLTNTGQMLNAMKVRVTSKGAEIYIERSSRTDSKLTNEDVALFASILRPFFHISSKQSKIINSRLQRLVRDKLRRSARR